MKKGTINLPDALKARIEQVARSIGRPEDVMIRDAIPSANLEATTPAPRIPLMSRGLGDPTIAEDVDAQLDRVGSETPDDQNSSVNWFCRPE